MKYFLPKTISVSSIYNEILPYLSKEYLQIKKEENVSLSMIYTERIDSNAIPLLMCILNILWNYHHHPVDLELAYTPRLLYFLDKIQFFRWGSQLDLISYDNDLIGGFSDYIHKEYNGQHKILTFWPDTDYSVLLPENKQEERDRLSEDLKYEIYEYIHMVARAHHLSDEDFEILRITTSELILNAQLYSKSMCYVYVQSGIRIASDKKMILLSIADIGEGFNKSMSAQIRENRSYSIEEHNRFFSRARDLGINEIEYRDYLAIMEALFYSQLQPRAINLYRLKNLLAKKHANLKIHNNSTQIVFTYDRCGICKNRDIFNCMDCLISNKNPRDKQKSAVKKYQKPLAGVHIDIEFITEDL